MKRVLLISYAFPPEPRPGALRPGYLARYLPQFGWEATVLTHSSGEPPFRARVSRAGAAPAAGAIGARLQTVARSGGLLRKILRTIKDTIAFPDELALWIPPAVVRGLELMRAERYDAIFTTALPTSTHVAGACLSKLTGTPWVADYRDAWSGNPYMPWGPVKRRLQRAAERFVMRGASAITTVSQPIAEHLQDLHRRSVSVIPNAYDPVEWEEIADETPGGFDLVYTGTMYGGKRSPELLFRALAELRDESHPLAGQARIHFYGHNNEDAYAQAQRYDLQSQVFIHGVVPRIDAMRAQRSSAALLIFLNMDAATASEMGSKYLEYAGARRPMLVFGPGASVMRGMVERAHLGWFASDVESAKQALLGAYARYSAGEYRFSIDESHLPNAVELARMFSGCLNAAASKDARALTTVREH